MPAVARSAGKDEGRRSPARERKGSARSGPSRPKKRSRKRKESGGFGRFVRGLAAVLVVVVALTPAYLWGGSRYFLGLDDGEVVAYRGLPYAPLGVELNEEWRRTDVQMSDVKTPYRGPIENHKLYTKDEVEGVLRDLGK
jgi:protein phosphatase